MCKCCLVLYWQLKFEWNFKDLHLQLEVGMTCYRSMISNIRTRIVPEQVNLKMHTSIKAGKPCSFGASGVSSIPANSDAQNVPSFRRRQFEMKLSPPLYFLRTSGPKSELETYSLEPYGLM
jgi:hypothetical protein